MSVDPGLGAWAQARLPASWRGIVFRVRESQIERGRRTAVHEYPFRDTVWVEDMNRKPRLTSFRGFLVGDDVDAQLARMIAAAEAPGPGTVVHPALGRFTASCMNFTASDADERGRVWQIEFTFEESAGRVFPGAATNTAATVTTAASAAAAPVASSFGRAMGPQGLLNAPAGTAVMLPALTVAGPGIAGAGIAYAASLSPGAAVVAGVGATIGGFGAQAASLAASVAPVARAAIGLAGNFGRFSLGARLATVPGLVSAQAALGAASAAAASVTRLGASLTGLAAKL